VRHHTFLRGRITQSYLPPINGAATMYGIGTGELILILTIAIFAAIWWKVGPPRLK
jgi:hypothetical protein